MHYQLAKSAIAEAWWAHMFGSGSTRGSVLTEAGQAHMQGAGPIYGQPTVDAAGAPTVQLRSARAG